MFVLQRTIVFWLNPSASSERFILGPWCHANMFRMETSVRWYVYIDLSWCIQNRHHVQQFVQTFAQIRLHASNSCFGNSRYCFCLFSYIFPCFQPCICIYLLKCSCLLVFKIYELLKCISLAPVNGVYPWLRLTHWGRDKMVAFSQTTSLNALSWMKMYEFRLKFHLNMFQRV